MAEKKFFVDINLQGSALTNATIGTNSSLTKAGSFGFDGTRLQYFDGGNVREVANLSDIAAVTGGLIFQGGYDPTTNTPDITVTDGTTLKGFFWVATATGTFLGESVQIGDSIVAKTENPGTGLSDWLILQGNIVIATDSVDGISRLATQAEANDGTEGGAVVITPATLQGKIDAQITPEISSKLPLAGGTMSGSIDMSGNTINGAGAVFTNNLASSLNTEILLLNDLSSAAGAKITNLPAPTAGGDATNKEYVDTSIANTKFSEFVPAANWSLDNGVYKVTLTHNLNSYGILFSAMNLYENTFDEFSYKSLSENTVQVTSNILPTQEYLFSILKG
jgi:hypothetical protein